MRDDLHHSLPLRHPWRQVLQAARATSGGSELSDAIKRAIQPPMAAIRNSAWGQQLQQVLDTSQADMFDPGERMARQLDALESSCPSSEARLTLEIAQATARSGDIGGDLAGRVWKASTEVIAENEIENVTARVASKFDEGQARQVRSALTAALQGCDMLRAPPKKKATKKPSVEQSLATPLALNV